jgi:nucleotide-binding universal stress UspA family protein
MEQEMKRYLIVANQTLGGPELQAAIRERAASGPAHFHVLVPNTPAEDHAPTWAGGLGTAAGGQGGAVFIAPASAGAPETGEEVTRVAHHRLDEAFRLVTEAGADVDGEIGEPDPFVAIRDVLQGQHFDEILLSTLPAGLSRWLRMDLPSRVQRHFDGPVTVIEASG